MSSYLRAAVGIIFLVVLTAPLVRAEQSGLDRTCALKEKDGVLRVECTNDTPFYFEDPIAIVDPVTGHFNPDCSIVRC